MTPRTTGPVRLPDTAPQRPALGDVLAPLRDAPQGRPFVIAQLGQSLDGRIATPTGASRWINGERALDHLHRLRANVDAVVVGIGTVIADDPQLTVRRVAGAQPARVVIDPNGRINPSAKVLINDGVRRVIVRAEAGPAIAEVEQLIVGRRDGSLDPRSIVSALYQSGFKKILVEGGAATVSAFINARAVDRLHVLVAPIILGSGTMGLALDAIHGLDEALRPVTSVHVLDDGDVLFDCDLSKRN